MKIVMPVIWTGLDPDAAVGQTINTAAALVKAGAEVTLLVPRRPSDPVLDETEIDRWLGREGGVAIEQWPISHFAERWLQIPSWLKRLKDAPSARRADIILSRSAFAMATGAGAGRKFLLDLFRTWPDNQPYLRPLFRRGIARKECLGLLLHSELAAQSFLAMGVDPAKVMVAHNGVNLASFELPLSQDHARQEFGIPGDRTVLAYSGRLAEWKGVGMLLAIAEARPDVLLVLAGSLGEGTVERRASALANVIVLPWLKESELARLYTAADILALPPSRRAIEHKRTVLPMKTFLYLASGKPILAPRLADTRDLLADGQTAVLVEPDDLDSAIAGLDRLLADPALAERLGRAGKALAATKSWEERGKKILAFIERRLGEGGQAAV